MSSSLTISNIELNDGTTIPQLGFGVFQVPPAETQQAVEEALEVGYRHIDTAAAYRNEEAVGKAIAASGISRDELYITTKLRNGEQGIAREAMENSLEALGLQHVDLYLIHWPAPEHDLYLLAWEQLVAARSDGLATSIGVSNFLPEHLNRLMSKTDVAPAVNQIELHPTFQQRYTEETTRGYGATVEAYMPIGQGKDLTYQAVISIAAEHEATAAQVVLAWHLAQGRIAIPKSVHRERMLENLGAVNVELSAEEVQRLSELDSEDRVGLDPATANFSML